jgi:hypothetical protein
MLTERLLKNQEKILLINFYGTYSVFTFKEYISLSAQKKLETGLMYDDLVLIDQSGLLY